MLQRHLRQSFVIDSLEFARRGKQLSGRIDIENLGRLFDTLFDNIGHVDFEVRGETADEGKKFLRLRIHGELHLQCQRCLGKVGFPLVLHNRLLLIEPGGVWPEEELEDDTFDAIEAERELDVASLVEEEILLALPQAPCHDSCVPPELATNGSRTLPFAALSGLKQRKI